MSTPVLVTLIITAGFVLIFAIGFVGSMIDKTKKTSAAVWSEGYMQGRLDEKHSALGMKTEYTNPYAKDEK